MRGVETKGRDMRDLVQEVETRFHKDVLEDEDGTFGVEIDDLALQGISISQIKGQSLHFPKSLNPQQHRLGEVETRNEY